MSESNATQVVLYSDQLLLAEGLRFAFSARPGFRLDASHCALSTLIPYMQAHAVDIVLLDVTEEVTIQALHNIRRAGPRSQIVLWASTVNREMAFQAMQAGVRGILYKSTSTDRFMDALRAIQEGELWFEKGMLESFLQGERVTLTHREGQLVTLLSQGLKNKEIAWSLRLSEGTVKVYLSRLYKKLGVNDRFELALYGLKNMQFGYASQADGDGHHTFENLSPSPSVVLREPRLAPPISPGIPEPPRQLPRKVTLIAPTRWNPQAHAPPD
jgi:DNA-binding NarL/FixJ family response regulator